MKRHSASRKESLYMPYLDRYAAFTGWLCKRGDLSNLQGSVGDRIR